MEISGSSMIVSAGGSRRLAMLVEAVSKRRSAAPGHQSRASVCRSWDLSHVGTVDHLWEEEEEEEAPQAFVQ
jgi:hypothetical protein